MSTVRVMSAAVPRPEATSTRSRYSLGGALGALATLAVCLTVPRSNLSSSVKLAIMAGSVCFPLLGGCIAYRLSDRSISVPRTVRVDFADGDGIVRQTHRVNRILAARSELLRGKDQLTINYTDSLPPQAMIEALEWCHTLQLPDDTDAAMSMLTASQALRIPDLKRRLEMSLARQVTQANANEMAACAEISGAALLNQHVAAFQQDGEARRKLPPAPKINLTPFSYLAGQQATGVEATIIQGMRFHSAVIAVACPRPNALTADSAHALYDWLYLGLIPDQQQTWMECIAAVQSGPLEAQLRSQLPRAPIPGASIPGAPVTYRAIKETVPHTPSAAQKAVFDGVSTEALRDALGHKFEGLQVLKLYNCRVSLATLSRFLNHHRDIQELHLIRTQVEGDVSHIFESLPFLRILNTDLHFDASRAAMATPELTVLTLTPAEPMDAEVLGEALTQWTQLEYVHLSHLGAPGVRALGRRCPHLVALKVDAQRAEGVPMTPLVEAANLQIVDWPGSHPAIDSAYAQSYPGRTLGARVTELTPDLGYLNGNRSRRTTSVTA
jgi:hypothetical protein